MKICLRCNGGNSDSALVCKECGESLSEATMGRAEEILQEKNEKREHSEKKKRLLKLMLIPLYYIIVIPVFVLILINEPEAWFPLLIIALLPLLYYLSVFKPDLLFELEYALNPKLSNAEPSDWYYTSSEIGGYVTLAGGIGFSIWLLCQCV